MAAAAGVSTATVSYVLNDVPNQTISAVTKERVRAAASELGYPSSVTTVPADRSALPIVLLNIGTDAIGKSLSGVIRTMQEELRQHDRTLIVTPDSDDAARALRGVLAPHAVVDLVRPLGGTHQDGGWGVFRGHQANFHFHSWMQLRHLAARGHRRVALASPASGTGVFGRARVADAHRAARELGLAPLTVMRVPMEPNPRSRTEIVRALARKTTVTAVAALDDNVALAVLAAMARLGYRAPEDLAVMGFDDEHRGHLWEPALTTVRIDATAYGRRAARLAVNATAQGWTEAPSEIVERASA
ncbi:substrate-binding domain-containing protein [Micromonospora sp. NPDC003197]